MKYAIERTTQFKKDFKLKAGLRYIQASRNYY